MTIKKQPFCEICRGSNVSLINKISSTWDLAKQRWLEDENETYGVSDFCEQRVRFVDADDNRFEPAMKDRRLSDPDCDRVTAWLDERRAEAATAMVDILDRKFGNK
jgi:hypothetical protein